MTRQLKEMILEALDNAGGVEYLAAQAEENPTAFLTLVGKVLPLQLTGENGGAIKVERVERVFTRPMLTHAAQAAIDALGGELSKQPSVQ